MKFNTQTKLNDPVRNIRGNCMMSCFAGYFDLNIDQVPPIEEFFDDPKVSWYWEFMQWLESMGYEEVRHGKNDPSGNDGFDDYYFATGLSPRGISHMVIYKDGHMVHDPHPSRAGLVSVNEFITLKKI